MLSLPHIMKQMASLAHRVKGAGLPIEKNKIKEKRCSFQNCETEFKYSVAEWLVSHEYDQT